MYRATRKRDEMGLHNSKSVGHIHISSDKSPNEYLEIIAKIITNATK